MRGCAGSNGEYIEVYPFKELLPHHTRFVIFCFRAWDHFNKARCPEFKEFILGYNEHANLPGRVTARRLIMIAKELSIRRLVAVITAMRNFLGPAFAGMQDDIWSKKSCRQSFGCARLSLAIDGDVLDKTLASIRNMMDRENSTVEKQYKLGRATFKE